jgi:hypothetical protein
MINRTSLAALFVAVWLAGCHPSSNPQQLLAEARQFETKGDFKSALIQAKNAVQADPNLAEAHFVVGAIYMDLGQWKLAEAKIREALTFKMDPNQAVPLLARSLLRQDKFQDVLDETVVERMPQAGRSAQVAALRGDANLGLLRIPAAKRVGLTTRRRPLSLRLRSSCSSSSTRTSLQHSAYSRLQCAPRPLSLPPHWGIAPCSR